MNFPSIYPVYSVRKIMFLVIIACIPGIFTKCYFFGSGTLIQIFFSIIIAILLEIIILKIRSKNIKIHLQDNSVLLTAILFGVSIPSLLPWWITMIGVFFSVLVGKHVYGGIGQNIFNPAMVGYTVLLISFPLYMHNWHENHLNVSLLKDIQKSFNIIFSKSDNIINDNINSNVSTDIFTEATPLDNLKIQLHSQNNYNSEKSVFDQNTISISNSWKYINISFFLGGIFLLFKKIICWRIPISFLIFLGFLSSINYFFLKDLLASPLLHFCSGGTMVCAFFISTDPVTTACTNIGKIIFGMTTAFLVWIIRYYSDYPDGIAFAVLLSNMIVPLIDYYIKTSGYGHSNI
ncbi:RnfABCDGE type electron transport complex subunit D [Buchnera aphidicola]|uniref:Ion-translocating oxidoreductase complex subunit D n=1 Tax=Buchnera aphidicola str. USDA (Myzus persicae) TaxID=1009856 RepID=W0P0J9_BUCMP|nr:RnfABCDGE type electron transport complex subunit D [Buchnera aphidicola]AHG60254.1 Ydgo [Buchnera aphidicola str. USDA (Myzus persicae)]AHG60832.1 Ydgo [Buchnera aphidicola str. W106 (Myzus persicae)]AHG61404.1 Ydgo [Buchnera aphidicola str. G002 (Myzus persicae)]AHG61977.1 Ydgo [Buchnera aphidicola str. F009 (Myzus persicae)]WAI03058.1 MAG: RnfABCDGE type electron transport complex subunit D [Buchnera aphidicola (Myzus persicae)]